MSFHLVNLAWQRDMRASKKIVLLALADFATQSTGECTPSVRVLSAKCGLSASAVRTQIKSLIADGLVELSIAHGNETFRVKLGLCVSIKIQSMVWDRYPGEDHELLLALKLADFCDDNGEHIFPSIETMAEKVRRSPRAVQYQIQGMVKSGWLVKVANAGGGRGRACEYRINPRLDKRRRNCTLFGWFKGCKRCTHKKGATGSAKRVQRAT